LRAASLTILTMLQVIGISCMACLSKSSAVVLRPACPRCAAHRTETSW
jgi:hypothetical protein